MADEALSSMSRTFAAAYGRRVSLNSARLSQHATRSALTHFQFTAHVLHCSPTPCREQTFRDQKTYAASRRIALSNSASASKRFNRAFSCSICLKRLA